MAKKDNKDTEVTISPKDLAIALEGIYQSILAVKRLVLKLDPDTVIKIKVKGVEPLARLWDTNCPPPE